MPIAIGGAFETPPGDISAAESVAVMRALDEFRWAVWGTATSSGVAGNVNTNDYVADAVSRAEPIDLVKADKCRPDTVCGIVWL
jgi:fumarate hydratase class II